MTALTETITVVIAEDDAKIAEIQRRFIERIPGFEVVGIAHGLQEADDLLDVLQPDLLLLDVHFPSGTGLELLHTLRGKNSTTDVILITAAQEVSTLREALRSGVFDYILKPLIFERLQQTFASFTQHRAALSQLEQLKQQDVDTLRSWGGHTPPSGTVVERLPKGVDSLTLVKVRQLLARSSQPLNAETVGEAIGASRTTARRYLEYMVSTREVDVEVSYGTVGRPERRYSKLAA